MSPTDSLFRRFRLTRILALTWVGYACYSLGRRPFAVARSVIQASTGMSKAETSVVDTAFLVAYTVGQMSYGGVKRQLGLSSRTLLVLGLAVSAACVAALAVCSDVVCFSAAWGALGIAQALGWASCLVVLTPWLGAAERGVVMGVWGTNMAAGGVLGNVLTSVAMVQLGSWRAAAVALAGLMAVGAAVLWRWLAGHPNQHGFLTHEQEARGDVSAAELRALPVSVDGEALAPPSAVASPDDAPPGKGAASAGDAAAALTTRQLMAVPGLMALSLSYCCNKLVRYVLIFWLPYFLSQRLGYSTAAAASLASALDVGGVVGSIGSGVFADRFGAGRRRTQANVLFIGGMVVSLFGLVFATSLPTAAVGLACFCCGFFAFGIDALMTGALVQDFADRAGMPRQLGAFAGFLGGVGTLGSILQGPVTVLLSGQWETLFVVLQALSVAAAALLARMALAEGR